MLSQYQVISYLIQLKTGSEFSFISSRSHNFVNFNLEIEEVVKNYDHSSP